VSRVVAGLYQSTRRRRQVKRHGTTGDGVGELDPAPNLEAGATR